jgi:hypothetical protein
LAAPLRGQAQCVLGDLLSDRQVHYTSLVEALQERFAPPNQMDFYRVQLKERRQKAECFKCGQKDHWKRECKEQQRRRPQTAETPVKSAARHLGTRRKHKRNHQRAYLGVNTSNKEAGMYIDRKINDLQTKFLVDTGATVSLVSNKTFYALEKSKRTK